MDSQQIWILIGGNAVATAVLGFLFKQWATHVFSRRLTVYTKEIEERNAAKLEILRLSFGKELQTFTAKNSILAQKHADVLSELYSRLWEIKSAIPNKLEQDPNTKRYGGEVWKLIQEARTLLVRNCIFLERDLSQQIEDLLHLLTCQIREYAEARSLPDTEEAALEFGAQMRRFRELIATLLERLERAFRQILRGED